MKEVPPAPPPAQALPATRRPRRRWWAVLCIVLSAVSLALLYLTGASLFLNSDLGPWVVNGGWRSEPRKVQLHWDSGTSVWPGRFEVRGVEIRGRNRRVDWSATIERGRGTIHLADLVARRVRVTHISGEGVRVDIDRLPEGAGEQAPQRPKRKRWTVDLPAMAFTGVREIAIGATRIEGDGRASGGFRSAAGEVSVEDGRLEMAGSRFEARNGELARDLELAVEASLAPYVPREHPGALGLEFLSGRLTAHGQLSAVLAPGPAGNVGGAPVEETGAFDADLRAEDGRLVPGTRFSWNARGSYPLTAVGSVAEVAGQPLLKIAIDSQGFEIGPREGQPPLLACRTFRIATASTETRLSRIFGQVREIRAEDGDPEKAYIAGEFLAEDLRLHLVGRRLTTRLAVDRAGGRLDLGAFLRRDLVVEGMLGEGVSAHLTVAEEEAEPPPAAQRPWSVRFTDTRLKGFENLGLDQLSLEGAAEAEASFTLETGGRMEVEHAVFSLPAGRLLDGQAVVAKDVAFEIDGRAEGFDYSQSSLAEALAAVSGTTGIRAEVASLGFLRSYFERARWLGLQGRGLLAANLTLDRGSLAPGSRLSVEAAAIEAQVLGAVARGRGRIEAQVEAAGKAPRLDLSARLDRFAVEDGTEPGRGKRFLEGDGLTVEVSSAEAVRLGAKPGDLHAVIDLPRASLPDLSAYNALLPPGVDVVLLPGTGSVRLHLELEGTDNTGKGELSFASDSARLRMHDLVLGGRLRLEAPLASSALLERRFDLDGTRLTLQPATYYELTDDAEEPVHPWWAQVELPDASLVMGQPIGFDGAIEAEMKDSGPFLALFAQRRRYLRWFSDVLLVEGVKAKAGVRVDGATVTVDPLEVTSDKMTLASRLRFAAGTKEGDLFLTYGDLAVGIELRDGKRDFKLLKPREWFESWWKQR